MTSLLPVEWGKSWLRGLPLWIKCCVALALAVILMFAGYAIAGGETNQVQAATDRATKAEAALAATRSQVNDLQGQMAQIQKKLDQQQSTLDGLQANAASVALQKQQLAALSAQLDQRSQALQQQQATITANTFSDGLYQVGTDIKAGQYHSAGGPHCYWAKLHSSDPSNIIVNSITAGPQTVVIDSPYFTTSGCGDWMKSG